MSNRNLFIAIAILSGVLLILILFTSLIGAFRAGKINNTPKITPFPTKRTTFSNNTNTPSVESRFKSIVGQNQQGLSPDQKNKLQAFQSKVPFSSDDFDIKYSSDLNAFVITQKNQNSDEKLRQFLSENGVLEIYLQGNGSFIVGNKSGDQVKDDIIDAFKDDTQHGEGNAENNPSTQEGPTDESLSSSQQDTQLLSDLLKTLLTINFETTPSEGPPGASPGPTGVTFPPNLGGSNGQGYYQMPSPTNGDYVIYSCPAHRFGQKELVGVLFTVAQNWKNAYPDSRLRIGDLNAAGHASHKWGYDVDINTWNIKTNSFDSGGRVSPDKSKSIELGKMFVNTKLIDYIFFNDPQVNAAVTAYARQNNLPLTSMQSWPGHEDHFHVRLRLPKGPTSAPGC